MKKYVPRYASPSTPDVKHDESNLLVEFMMLNKYGVLKPYPWRKGQPLAGEWGQVCKVMRRLLKSMKIHADRLAWFIRSQKVTSLNYEEFGLVRWKINRLFPATDLITLAARYASDMQMAARDLEQDARLNAVTSYTMKEQSSTRKSLTDLIKELEHDGGRERDESQEDTGRERARSMDDQPEEEVR